MIELIFEIRRCCPSELKPSIKLTNPNLFDELLNHYDQDISSACKAQIKELFSLVNTETKLPTSNALAKQGFLYRGQSSTAPTATSNQASHREQEAPKTFRKQRIYRGQLVDC